MRGAGWQEMAGAKTGVASRNRDRVRWMSRWAMREEEDEGLVGGRKGGGGEAVKHPLVIGLLGKSLK